MRTVTLGSEPEGDIVDDNALRCFLRSDFPNRLEGIQGWIKLFDTDELTTEDVLWENIRRDRLLTVEEYIVSRERELQIVELTEEVKKFQKLAVRGNVALVQKDLEALRLVLQEYEDLFTQIFPDFGAQAGTMLKDVVFE